MKKGQHTLHIMMSATILKLNWVNALQGHTNHTAYMHKMQLWFILQLYQKGLKLKFIQQQDGVSEALTIRDCFHDLVSC